MGCTCRQGVEAERAKKERKNTFELYVKD